MVNILLEEIGNYLQGENIGILSDSIFLGELPNEPDNCIAIYEYAGQPPEFGYGVEIDKPGLQIRVRNISYPDGRQKIQDIQNVLHKCRNITLSGTHYTSIFAIQGITPLGQDGNNRIEFVQNFKIIKERG